MFTLRISLSLLVVVCIAPIVTTTALLVHHIYETERASRESARLETVRALMQAVDRELSSAQGTLQALATSPHLGSGNLAAFYAQAKDVQRYWTDNNFVLSNAAGEQLLNTLMPYGASLPRHGNPAQLHRVFDTARPVISDIYLGGVTRHPVISIDVPVLKDGRVAYDLSMGFLPSHLGEILLRQRIPAASIAAIFDSRGVVVARTWEPERFVGQYGTPALVRRMMVVREDSIESVTLEGIPVVIAFSRSSLSNWSVAIGVPKSVITHEIWVSVAWIAGIASLSLLIGLVLATLVADRIANSIAGLLGPAKALGYGEQISIPPLWLKEANDVAQALVMTSRLLRKRTDERDTAAKSEQEIRKIQQRLELSEAFQRRIFEEAPDAIIVVSPSGRIVRANAETERLFGYTGEQLLGMSVESLVPPELRQRHASHRDSYLARPARRPMGSNGNLVGRRSDGTDFPMDTLLSPLHSPDGDLVIATVRDITELRRHESQIGAALREKEILLKELYHRVKNNLQVIASMMNLQERGIHDDATRMVMREAADRVRAMALVHEKLYQSGDLSSIALDDYITDLCKRLGNAAGASQRGIALVTEVEPVRIGIDAAVPLGLILNELVSNCLQHAFPDDMRGRITIRLEKTGDAALRLTVADDGVGLPAGMEPTASPSLGLKLILALAAQLDGQFSITSQQGTSASFEFPCNAQEVSRSHTSG